MILNPYRQNPRYTKTVHQYSVFNWVFFIMHHKYRYIENRYLKQQIIHWYIGTYQCFEIVVELVL